MCIRDSYYTSIHLEEYELDARDTKLGPEEITRDIPNDRKQLRIKHIKYMLDCQMR